MKIKKYSIYHVKIPFNIGYEHNTASRYKSDSIILEINDDRGNVCYGECAPRNYVTGESSSQIVDDIHCYIESYSKVVDNDIESIRTAGKLIPNFKTALRSIFEIAYLNLLAARSKKNIIGFLHGKADFKIEFSAALTGGSREQFLNFAQLFYSYGMNKIKIKLTDSQSENNWRLKYLNTLYQNDIEIRVDGNEIWDVNKAMAQIPELIKNGVTKFEQLLFKDDFVGQKKLYDEFNGDANFILDESITSEESLDKWLLAESFHCANLKISKNAGILTCLDMANSLKNAGLDFQLGAHVGETSILTLAGISFLSASPKWNSAEGAFGDNLLEIDPFYPSIKFGQYGHLDVGTIVKQLCVDKIELNKWKVF